MDGPHVHHVVLIIVAVAKSIEGCLAESFRSLAIPVGASKEAPLLCMQCSCRALALCNSRCDELSYLRWDIYNRFFLLGVCC